MFRLALSSHIYFCFRDTNRDTLVFLRPETRGVATRVSGRKWVQSTEFDIVNGSFCNFMWVGSLAGVTYLRYTVLTSPNKGETAVHCCDPAISVLVMLVSRNPFSRSISLAVLFVLSYNINWKNCLHIILSVSVHYFFWKMLCFKDVDKFSVELPHAIYWSSFGSTSVICVRAFSRVDFSRCSYSCGLRRCLPHVPWCCLFI